MIDKPEADPSVAGAAAVVLDAEPTLKTTPQRFGDYEVVSRLGAGGMGEVFLATDNRLGRKVALKILPVELTNDPERILRLGQEARTTSALNHPNIVTIHELGLAGSSPFIAQEYVEGVTLRDMLRAEPLPLEKVLDITAQVLAALHTAHSAGIIHRDIKPENIMVRPDGLVKVLDFGLAKFVSGTEPQQMKTSAGVILGTPQYMSPEQVRGTDLDARSDLWSVGVVLYEMIAQRRPFEAPTASAAIARILQDEPATLDVLVPSELRRILTKVLAKNRDERYGSAADFAADLRNLRTGAPRVVPRPRRGAIWIAAALIILVAVAGSLFVPHLLTRSTGAGKPIDSLAVLPFVNETGSRELEYIADGLTDTMTNAFSGIESFRVVPRASVFHYKGRGTDPLTVARELKVRAILAGRVMKAGEDALVIQAELIDSAKGSQIWGERFTAGASDALALQQRISRAVLDRLAMPASSLRSGTTDERAFDLYLRARHAAAQRTPAPLESSIALFKEVIQNDPEFAAGYRGLADAYMLSAEYAGVPWEDVHELAVSALQKSLVLDPVSAEGHAYLGRLHAFEWEWKEAEAEYSRALQLDPGYAPAYIYYGNLFRRYERPRQSLDYYQRGLQLDPMSKVLRSNVIEAHIAAGDLQAAETGAQELLRIDPVGPGRRFLAHIHAIQGRPAEAVAELDRLIGVVDRAPGTLALIGATYAIAGERRKALDLAHELEERYNARRAPAVSVAEVYAGLGDREKVFEWLAKDSSKGPRMSLIPGRIYFRSVHDDPRWEGLMQKMQLRGTAH